MYWEFKWAISLQSARRGVLHVKVARLISACFDGFISALVILDVSLRK